MIHAVKASCVTMHKCMDLNTACDCLYSTLCCSEGLEDNPELLAWIPREPELSPEWWPLLGEFNNQFEELMTERFKWQNPRGGVIARDVQRLRNAYQGSSSYERRIGADIWMAMQTMLQLNMQRRDPPMMPIGAAATAHSRGKFTSYLKAIPGPTMFQIPKWEKPGMWREKSEEDPEPVVIPPLVPQQWGIEVPPMPIGPPPPQPQHPQAQAQPEPEAEQEYEGEHMQENGQQQFEQEQEQQPEPDQMQQDQEELQGQQSMKKLQQYEDSSSCRRI
jgi:hypothetical protein